MSTHDFRYPDDNVGSTPLNDNGLYALECAKYWEELATFTWSREDVDARSEVASQMGDEEQVEQTLPDEQDGVNPWDEAEEQEGGGWERERDEGNEQDDAEAVVIGEPTPPSEDLMTPTEMIDDALATSPVSLTGDCVDGVADHEVKEMESATQPPSDRPLTLETLDNTRELLASSPLHFTEEMTDTSTIRAQHEKSPNATPTALSPISRDSAELCGGRNSPKVKTIPLRSAKNQLRLSQLGPHGRPSSLLDRPFSQSSYVGMPSPGSASGHSHELRLPSGLPQSGLSVSDLISIPSPGLGSPNRIIRRHLDLPSVETAHHARLSVELHGTITQLGDEDWEELEVKDADHSAPNVPPSNFFSRVLKRRPSTIQSSSLSRQLVSSSSSSTSSPTKSRHPSGVFGTGGVGGPKFHNSATTYAPGAKGVNSKEGKFGSRSLETTKRAFEKIRAFPILRKTSGLSNGEASSAPSPPKSELDETLRRSGVRQETAHASTPMTNRQASHNGAGAVRSNSRMLVKAKGSPMPRHTSLSDLDLSVSSRTSILPLPPKISPLSESFKINHPNGMAPPLHDHMKKGDVYHEDELDASMACMSSGAGPSRPSGPRRNTESGTVWLDKKPRLCSKGSMNVSWSKKTSASASTATSMSSQDSIGLTSSSWRETTRTDGLAIPEPSQEDGQGTMRKKSRRGLFRSASKIRPGIADRPVNGSKSESALNVKRDVAPRLELRETAPLEIEWT